MHQILTRICWSVLALTILSACTLNTSPQVEQIAISGVPVVQLAAPRSGSTFLEGVAVNIQALVTNAGSDIDRIEIAVGGSVVASVPSPNITGAAAFPVISAWMAAGEGATSITVTAFRADGSSSEPATAEIAIVSAAGTTATEEPTEEAEPEETETEEAETVEDEDVVEAQDADESSDEGEEEGDSDDSDTASSGAPIATFNVGANVRRGPGRNFDPPLGGIPAGQTAELLARSPDGAWYKIRYYNADGWVAASLVSVNGNTASLPVDAGPATPVPVTPTPIPPTPAPAPPQEENNDNNQGAAAPGAPSAPQGNADIVAGNLYLSDDSPTCGEAFTVAIDIANLGSDDSDESGRFRVRDVHIASGTVTSSADGEIPEIDEGQTVRSAEVELRVNTFFNETHRIEVILNDNGEIPESNTGNNIKTLEYTLERGDC
jgi:uncharacterized protein YgiM (DUF1202 family)